MDLTSVVLIWIVTICVATYNIELIAPTMVEAEYAGGFRQLWARASMGVATISCVWWVMLTICLVLVVTGALDAQTLTTYVERSSWLFVSNAIVHACSHAMPDTWAVSFRHRLMASKSTYAESFAQSYLHYHGITTWKQAFKLVYDDAFANKPWAWRVSMVLLTIGTLGVAPVAIAGAARFAAPALLSAPPVAEADKTEE